VSQKDQTPVSADIIYTSEQFPAPAWFEAVGNAIGATPAIVDALLESWVLLNLSPKEIQQRLTILAQANGKRLVFRDPTPPS